MRTLQHDAMAAHDLLLADVTVPEVILPSWILAVEMQACCNDSRDYVNGGRYCIPVSQPVVLTKPAWRVTIGRVLASRRSERLF